MPESDAFAQESDQDQLQEKYLKAHDQIKEGELVEGKVIQIDDDYVYLDVGLKADGKVPIAEFKEKPAIDDITDIFLEKRETSSGDIIISKKKAEKKVFLKKIKNAYNSKEPITGKVFKSIKGGYEVYLGCGMKAFCPISKMDIQRIGNPEKYLGGEFQFLIDSCRMSEENINIVLTRRLFLEQEIERNRDAFFDRVNVSDEVEGVVKTFTSFGIFIDLGGFDGLLHNNDISWCHVVRPRDYVKKGEKIKLKIIRLDHESKKINLSLKHFQPDPWHNFEEKYKLNQVVKGSVTKMTDYGAFIEIEEGIEGLAHISELSWIKRIKHPAELFNIGDECETMILGYDIPNGRISLGLKQILPNPWDEIESKYPVGTKGQWMVKKITNAGAFIKLEEGIEAFLHTDDLSWTKKIRKVSSILKVNELIEAVVISVKPGERRIHLGVKQLSENPWVLFHDKYPPGTIIKGEITGKTEFGVFVKVEGDIEGLIHKNNLTTSREEDPEEKLVAFNVGDIIEAAVIDVNISKKRLSLSVREMQYREERAEISKYIDGEDDSESSYTLADMLKDKGE